MGRRWVDTVALDSRNKIQAMLDAIEAEASAEVAAAVAQADADPWPAADSAFTDVQDTGAGTWR